MTQAQSAGVDFSQVFSLGALSFRNRIINGAFQIAARGGSVVVTAGNSYGGPDRFQCTIGGSAGGQVTQAAGGTMSINGVPRYTIRQTCNTPPTTMAGGAYWSGIQQMIEGYNAYDLLGQSVVISFWFNSNVVGLHSVSLSDSGNYSFVGTFNYAVANTPQRIVIYLPSLPTAMSVPNTNALGLVLRIGAQNNAQYNTANVNTWQSGNWLVASGYTAWNLVANNFIEVADLQLEQGTVVTPFERRNIAIEGLICQRYYNAVGQLFGAGYVQNSLTSAVYIMAISPVMRVAPTVTFSGTFTFGAATAGGQNLPATSMVNASVTPSMLYVQATGLSGVTGGQGTILSGLGGSLIALSAEI